MYRRVREGNGYRIDLEGMYLKPPTFAWFKFPRGTIFDLRPLEEEYVFYERYELVHGSFYLPLEFDLHADLSIQRADGRRTRLRGTVTMPPGHRFTMIPENKVWYYVERPYTGEDFSVAFITMEGMEFRFPTGSSIYIDDADNVQYHDNEEGHRDEIQPNTEKPTEQALPAFIDLTGINDIYDMEENRPASAEEVTAAGLNLTDAGMKEKHHENTEATECVPKLLHSDGAIDNEHNRGLGRSGEQQVATETNAEKQATNVPSEPLPLTTDMEGININDLDIVDLQTMVPPDMDSQLLTNDFLQMGYAVRRPRTDHIPDVDPKMRIRRILEVKRKHDQQTSKHRTSVVRYRLPYENCRSKVSTTANSTITVSVLSQHFSPNLKARQPPDFIIPTRAGEIAAQCK
ncbi:hypothetical protein R1sor_005695 [Riccia sorocarpa]|uniref:Uncharacterized protein n=1 Tax=Riccia sorocarpa TaxID=122646 RepID=A0ABD3HRT0_9MARC